MKKLLAIIITAVILNVGCVGISAAPSEPIMQQRFELVEGETVIENQKMYRMCEEACAEGHCYIITKEAYGLVEGYKVLIQYWDENGLCVGTTLLVFDPLMGHWVPVVNLTCEDMDDFVEDFSIPVRECLPM